MEEDEDGGGLVVDDVVVAAKKKKRKVKKQTLKFSKSASKLDFACDTVPMLSTGHQRKINQIKD